MPEDRFGDLGEPGGGGRADRERSPAAETAAERIAREDEREAASTSGEAPVRSRYSIAAGAGIIALGVLVLVGVAAGVINSSDAGSGSVRGPARGSLLPVFAAPLATGRLEGDANVKPRPGPPDPEVPPACEVRGPDVVNLCQLRRRPLVLTFVVLRGTECEPELSAVERVRRAYPRVAFAAVVSGESRATVERIVRGRRLGYPVAVDPDGAVVNLNRVGVCPTTTLADPGGRVRDTRIGSLRDRDLRTAVAALDRDHRGR